LKRTATIELFLNHFMYGEWLMKRSKIWR